MHDIGTIKAINHWSRVYKAQKRAEAMNKLGGHAKDSEKGRRPLTPRRQK